MTPSAIPASERPDSSEHERALWLAAAPGDMDATLCLCASVFLHVGTQDGGGGGGRCTRTGRGRRVSAWGLQVVGEAEED